MDFKSLIKVAAETTTPAKIQPIKGAGSDLVPTIMNIINAIIGVLAIVCVVVIIMGGVTYMTSAGDAGKVKKAKDTILYAAIGLIVCALAAVIVNFVISNIIGA